MYAAHVSTQSVTVNFEDGTVLTCPSAHPNFKAVREAIMSDAPDEDVKRLIDIVAQTQAQLGKIAAVTVSREGVLYEGKPLHMSVTRRIMEFQAEGHDVGYLLKFVENVMQNPYRDAVLSTYDFLEANQVPITPDGCFYAFKKVKSDYTDYYTGTFDNSPGKVVEVRPNEVDADRTQTCSNGLHVCAMHYLPSYHGGEGTVVICKINPAHVVAVPADYNNSKMRVYRYEVVGELNDEQKADIFQGRHVIHHGDASVGVDWHERAVDQELAEYPDDETVGRCWGCDNPEDECSCNECNECGDNDSDSCGCNESQPDQDDPPADARPQDSWNGDYTNR